MENFKCFTKKTVEFDTDATRIKARNKAGKSTVQEAYFWVLANARGSVAPKDKVDATTRVMIVLDGVEYERVMLPDGKSEYFIDSVPAKAKDITGKFPKIKEYSLPGYIMGLSTDKKRKELFGSKADKIDKATAKIKRIKKELKTYEPSAEKFSVRKGVIDDIINMSGVSEEDVDEYYVKSGLDKLVDKYYQDRRNDVEQEQKLTKELSDCESTVLETTIKSGIPYDVKLTEMLKNGSEKAVCDVYMDGIKWDDLNHASKIQEGIRLISYLSDKDYPLWIDDAEGVQNIPYYSHGLQLIILEADKPYRGQFKTIGLEE